MRATAARLLDALRGRARRVLWVGMANVGLAPLFLPPFSWWMTARTRRANGLLAAQMQAARCYAEMRPSIAQVLD